MSFVTDLRVGLRGLRRQPGFTAVVVLTLAVGIGANGAIFSVVEQVLLRTLPYPEPDRVVQVWANNEERGWQRLATSLHDFEDWQARSETLEAIGVYNLATANLSYGDIPARVTFAQVSSSVFGVLGTAPTLGRTLRPEEDLPGNDAVAVVSYTFWQEVLGGDAAAVGSRVEVDGTSLHVVGVMPDGFYFPTHDTSLWRPFGMTPEESGARDGRWVSAVGRLADGQTVAGAQEEMTAVAAALAAEYPDTNDGFGVLVEPRAGAVVRTSVPVVLVAWAVVSLVLLIACANVANLVLARSASRGREIALRASLGAGRGRLVRQLLTESLLLGAAGGAAGVLLASWITTGLRSLEFSGIARLEDVAVTWPVVAYATVLSVFTAALFGLAPALRLSQVDLSRRLREGRSASGGRRRRRMQELLVVAQLALSVVVLVGAALMLRTFWNLSHVELGFEVQDRVEARVSPSRQEIAERPAAVVVHERIVERLRQLPGVDAVGAINALPLLGANAWRGSLTTRQTAEGGERASVGYRVVVGDYFEALDIGLVAGRLLDARDVDGAQPVAVVSRSAASALWQRDDPLDRELWLVPEEHPEHKRFRVVGIVEDVVDNRLTLDPSPLVYFNMPQAQWGHFQDWGMSFVVSGGDAAGRVEPVRVAVEEVSGGLPVFGVQVLEDRLGQALAPSRFNLVMIGCLGAVALLLASLGVYGVIGFMVTQRTREIGTRVALGAEGAQVLRLVVARGIALAVGGVGLGLMAAYSLRGTVEGMLFGIETADPISYAGIATTLLAVSVLAAFVPARRAAALDPIVCLRDN